MWRRVILHQIFRQLTHAWSSEILEGWVIHPRPWSYACAVESPHRPRDSVLQVRKLIEGGKYRLHDGFCREVPES